MPTTMTLQAVVDERLPHRAAGRPGRVRRLSRLLPPRPRRRSRTRSHSTSGPRASRDGVYACAHQLQLRPDHGRLRRHDQVGGDSGPTPCFTGRWAGRRRPTVPLATAGATSRAMGDHLLSRHRRPRRQPLRTDAGRRRAGAPRERPRCRTSLPPFDAWQHRPARRQLAGRVSPRRPVHRSGTAARYTKDEIARVLTAYRHHELGLDDADEETRAVFADVHGSWLPTYQAALERFDPFRPPRRPTRAGAASTSTTAGWRRPASRS